MSVMKMENCIDQPTCNNALDLNARSGAIEVVVS